MVMTVTKKYHVGVSYANEDQDIVKSVVKALESVGLTVFFDQKEATQLVGKNLTYTLPEIYRNCCEYCLMFVSNSYVSKKWTTYERDWLLDKRIELQRDDVFTDCIIPVFIDRMDMPGLNPGIVGFDIRKQSADDIARIMYEKIAGSESHMIAEPLSLETVFNKILAAVEDLLTKQSTCPYQTDRLSEYDVVVHLSAEDNDYFLRLALEEPLHGLLKIAQGEVFMPQQEWIWDAEAYLEDGQLQFINYNLTPEFPGLPHPYTVEKLCKAVLQKVSDFVKEYSHV